MPIRRATAARDVPDWADFSDWGVSRMPAGQHVERHFHDAHEFVLIVSGRVEVRTEGLIEALGPGDAVLTRMGDDHEWLALEDSTAIWAVSALMGRRRPGHLIPGRDDRDDAAA